MIHEIIENVVENDYYDFLCQRLKEDGVWYYASTDEGGKRPTPNDDMRSDTGFLFQAYHSIDESPRSPVLTSYAHYIIQKYFDKSAIRYDKVSVRRIFYNYYNQSSSGVYHEDHHEKNTMSLVITLNECDGGTYIEDEFIPSKQGKIVAFDSTDQHRGVGPTEYKSRFAMNVIFTYDNMEFKT